MEAILAKRAGYYDQRIRAVVVILECFVLLYRVLLFIICVYRADEWSWHALMLSYAERNVHCTSNLS